MLGLIGKKNRERLAEPHSAEDPDATQQILGGSISCRIAFGPQWGRRAFMLRIIRPLGAADLTLPRQVRYLERWQDE